MGKPRVRASTLFDLTVVLHQKGDNISVKGTESKDAMKILHIW